MCMCIHILFHSAHEKHGLNYCACALYILMFVFFFSKFLFSFTNKVVLVFAQGLDNVPVTTAVVPRRRTATPDCSAPRIDSFRFSMANLEGEFSFPRCSRARFLIAQRAETNYQCWCGARWYIHNWPRMVVDHIWKRIAVCLQIYSDKHLHERRERRVAPRHAKLAQRVTD